MTAVTTLSAGRPQVCASRCSNEFSLYLPHFSASVSRRSHPISPGNGHIEGKRDDVSAPGNRQGAPPVRQGASTHLSTRVPRVSIWQPWAWPSAHAGTLPPSAEGDQARQVSDPGDGAKQPVDAGVSGPS